MILGLLAFGTTVAFWPGVYGPATAPRWMLLTVALPLLLLFTRPAPEVTWPHRLGLALLAWAALTMLWTPQPLDGLEVLVQLSVGAAAFIVGARAASLEWFYAGLGSGVAFSVGLALAQWYDPSSVAWTRTVYPAGLFVNAGVLAEAAVLVLVVAVAQRMWVRAVLMMPALLVTGSRGAYAALAVVCTAWAWRRSRLVGASMLVLILGALVLVGAIGWRSDALIERLQMWVDTARGVSLLGAGIGSFASQFPHLSTGIDTLAARPEHAHNDLLEIAFELGVVGLGLAVAFLIALLRRGFARDDQTEALVLTAFVVLGLFSFSMHNPLTLLAAMVCAGRIIDIRGLVRGVAGVGGDRVRVRTTVQAGAASASYPALSVFGGHDAVTADVSYGVGVDAGGVRPALQNDRMAERGAWGAGGGAGF